MDRAPQLDDCDVYYKRGQRPKESRTKYEATRTELDKLFVSKLEHAKTWHLAATGRSRWADAQNAGPLKR